MRIATGPLGRDTLENNVASHKTRLIRAHEYEEHYNSRKNLPTSE